MKYKFFAIFAVFAMALSVVGSAVPASAADFLTGEGDNFSVLAPASQTYSNLYVVGADVLINSAVTGDLYGMGADVIVDGEVSDDLSLIGGTISINSPVAGDVRIVGGTVTINTSIAGDLMILGGNVIISDKASIGGELYFFGGEINVAGPVAGKVSIKAESVTINSALASKVSVEAREKFIIGSNTEIAETINYKGKTEAVVNDGAKVNEVNFEAITKKNEDNKGVLFGIYIFGAILKIIAIGLAALILIKLFGATSHRMVVAMRSSFWKNLGIGFLGLIVTPFAIIALLLTGIGVYLSLILIFVYALFIVIASILSVVFIGVEVMKLINKQNHAVLSWQAVLLGAVITVVLGFIPIIGWIFMAILFLASMGVLIATLYGTIGSDEGVPHINVVKEEENIIN